MKVTRWQLKLAGTLIALSIAFYTFRWAAFGTAAMHNEMWRFLLGDIAFLFIQVPIVTLLIDSQFQRRQREEMLNKLNMVIGAFFSEAGTELLGTIAEADTRLSEVRRSLVPDGSWTAPDYALACSTFTGHDARIDLAAVDLHELKRTLKDQKHFLLGLLSNQNLLEHESFTDLLWSLTHLAEELAAREDLDALHTPDAVHLAGDLKRVYALLGKEWLAYLAHLQAQYPYLFSLAVRTNPLDPEARVAVAG